MALIDELREKLETVEAELDGFHADVREIGKTIEALERMRWDLDTTIAALTPQDAPDATAAVAEPEIPEGFTKWEGGECPVSETTTTEVLYRSGTRDIFTPDMITDGDTWHRRGDYLDIIAYRIIKASDVEEAERIEGSSALVSSPGEGEESRDQSETTESEPDPVLRAFEDDASEFLLDDDEREERINRLSAQDRPEGYAPVVAKRLTDEEVAATLERITAEVVGDLDLASDAVAADEPEPSLLDRFNPFRVKADA